MRELPRPDRVSSLFVDIIRLANLLLQESQQTQPSLFQVEVHDTWLHVDSDQGGTRTQLNQSLAAVDSDS